MEQKVCFRCQEEKFLSEFYKHPQMPDGTVNKCKECNKVENKANWHNKREQKRQYDQQRHRYSFPRLFSNRYQFLRGRCEGKLGRKYPVQGMSYLSQKEWNDWCHQKENMRAFLEIHTRWVESDFDRSCTPTIDRIDKSYGYVAGNIQWLSLRDNMEKG